MRDLEVKKGNLREKDIYDNFECALKGSFYMFIEPYITNMIIVSISILFVNTVILQYLDTIPMENSMSLMEEYLAIEKIFNEKLII